MIVGTRALTACAVLVSALCIAQGAMGQEPLRGVCDSRATNGCAAGTGQSTFSARPPPLFTPVSDATQVDLIEPSTTSSAPTPHRRHQAVQIDFGQLNQAREALAEGLGAELSVNLPELPLPVVLTTTSDTHRGYALSGRVADDPLSAVNIVVNGRSVAGNIRHRTELHTIRTAGAGYYVQTLDGLTGPRCEIEQLGELGREAAQAPPAQSPAVADVVQNDGVLDDGSEIDVLVVYTPNGRRSAGGHQGIRTLMELLVQETNQAYSDSDVRQRIRLVAATEVSYEFDDVASTHEALHHLTEEADGYMDEVHQLRDLYAADLVLLYQTAGGGVAWHIPDPAGATAHRHGFSVSNWHVFAHELGHNMGLLHGRTSDAGNLPYAYSHGYSFRHRGAQYHTIMATAQGLPRFSNPRQLFPNDLGVPLGVPGETPTSSPNGPADAARSLNETAASVARFRSSATRCVYGLPSPIDMDDQGGSFTISIAAASDCSWDARSLSPGLTVTEGNSGTGDGEVTFAVEQNPGWPREMALRVAGEVYSFHQEGRRQSVSVCDRSGSAREAISTALEGRACADIVAADLARIGSLSVVGNVSPGDFDGLTGLGSLTLRLPRAPRLDQGTFSGAGLENLHRLSLIASSTSTLHLRRGVFEGLEALQELALFRISWDEGVFEDVPALNNLSLFDYPRIILPNGAFRGLSMLTNLYSHRGLFETVDTHSFQGLASLRQLQFLDGHLAHLPHRSFEHLPELAALVLERNHLTNLRKDQFRGASKLLHISLEDNPVRSVESGAFRNLPLRYLNLRNSDLTSLELGAFSELLNCTLDLSGNKLTTLARSVFAGAGLYRLDLSNNDIADISFLSGLRYAHEIDLSGNRVADLSPLMDIIHLRTLDLSENRIVDVAPLADLSDRLIELDLSHNDIDDISPLLVPNGPMSEDSVLYLHGNRLHGIAFDDHVAMLRSWGVKVLHVRVWPGESSALEGEQFEFAVHLSSEVGDSVSVNWQLVFAQHPHRATPLAGVYLTAVVDDFGIGSWGCGWGFCHKEGSQTGGELTIAAMRRLSYANVGPAAHSSEPSERSSGEEEHETFAFVLLPHASTLPEGVALDAFAPLALQRVFGAPRLSVGIGLIVDPAGPSHHVPLFLGRGDAWGRRSVLRLVHPMDGSPAHVEVFDGLGRKHGATTLSTREALSRCCPTPSRRAVAEFDSDDLEDGNYDKGLSRGVGGGSADWQLRIWANDVKALSYVRHADGFLTSAHDVVAQGDDGTYAVPIFIPAGDTGQRSVLRLLNLGTAASEVRIVGTDDAGARPGGPVRLTVEPGGARELSAADIESGARDLRGALGDGQGDWRLAVTSDAPILVASLLESPTGYLSNLSTVPDNKERQDGGATTHHVPLFLSAADEWGRRSFVRVVNNDEAAAVVRIRPFDDTVHDYGSVSLTVAAGEVAYFNSHDLEAGGRGLSGGVGAGEGDWRLELDAVEDIDVFAYVRHADGFLTSMHDVVGASAGRHIVPIFNAADDDQKSLLRLVNPRAEDAEVSIRGFDDRGAARGRVSLVVPAGRSRTIAAQEMEAGHDSLEGALGDGEGKWRLVVKSDVQIQVMSLLEGAAGHLTNLSTTPLGLER